MSCRGNSSGSCGCGGSGSSLARQISRFVGETVTIFTTSGGASGCGFTGVVLSVNSCFVRLVTDFGMAPTNPLAENICGDMDNGNWNGGRGCGGNGGHHGNGDGHGSWKRQVGSVCDIPIDRIAAFCHNAV